MVKSTHTRRYRRFLALLVEARKAAGLSQVQVAKKLRKPQSYVSKCECGERRVDVDEFLRFAEAIGFDAGTMIRDL